MDNAFKRNINMLFVDNNVKINKYINQKHRHNIISFNIFKTKNNITKY
jgi:hypothetical protein